MTHSKRTAPQMTMTDEVLFDLILHSYRSLSMTFFAEAIRKAERAEAIGPIFHPSEWNKKNVFEMHSLNLDIMRRAQDLRFAIAAADELQEKLKPKSMTEILSGMTSTN